MAENISIATLTIDDSGIVSGVARASGAVGELDHEISRAGPAFVHHMLSMRAAAAAFLGAFSLAGLIVELSNLTTEVVKNSDAWKRLKTNVEDAYGQFVKMESMTSTLARHLQAGEQAAGVMPLSEIMKKMSELTDAKSEAEQQLSKLRQTISFGGFTGTAEGGAAETLVKARLDQITESMFKLQTASGLTVQQFDSLFGTNLQNATVRAQRLSEALGPLDTVLHGLPQKAIRVSEAFDDMKNPIRSSWEEMDYGRHVVLQAGEAYAAFGDELDSVLETDFTPLHEHFKALSNEMLILQEVTQVAIPLLVNSLAQAGQSWKQAVGELLKAVANICFTMMAAHIAAAIGSTTFLGIALTGGTPTQHQHAAAAWGAAGVGAALLAGEFGKSAKGPGGGGAGGGYAGAASSPPAAPSYNISLNIQGNVIGNDDFTRGVIVDIKKALADGASGGGF
jgi:hypothetical protein